MALKRKDFRFSVKAENNSSLGNFTGPNSTKKGKDLRPSLSFISKPLAYFTISFSTLTSPSIFSSIK